MLFSILTTSYNQSKTIRATLESCLNQTFNDYEIIVSDDGSNDNSEEIILAFDNPKIRYYKQPINLKEYRNRNFLINNAKGEYIIFIDGEDIIYPHCLEVFDYYLKVFPGIAMLITLGWDPRLIYPIKLNPRQLYAFEFLDSGLFGGNFTNMLFKKEVLINVGLLPTHVRSVDTYIQHKIALSYDAVIIADGLAWWRRSTGNVTEKLNPYYSAKDYSHLANTITYKQSFLNDPLCALNEKEKNLAKINMYGSALRIVIRWILKFQFLKIYYLFKNLDIPLKYWSSLFVKEKRNYFKEFSGNNPMITEYKYKKNFNNTNPR